MDCSVLLITCDRCSDKTRHAACYCPKPIRIGGGGGGAPPCCGCPGYPPPLATGKPGGGVGYPEGCPFDAGAYAC